MDNISEVLRRLDEHFYPYTRGVETYRKDVFAVLGYVRKLHDEIMQLEDKIETGRIELRVLAAELKDARALETAAVRDMRTAHDQWERMQAIASEALTVARNALAAKGCGHVED